MIIQFFTPKVLISWITERKQLNQLLDMEDIINVRCYPHSISFLYPKNLNINYKALRYIFVYYSVIVHCRYIIYPIFNMLVGLI
jgi:hypothetical protein